MADTVSVDVFSLSNTYSLAHSLKLVEFLFGGCDMTSTIECIRTFDCVYVTRTTPSSYRFRFQFKFPSLDAHKLQQKNITLWLSGMSACVCACGCSVPMNQSRKDADAKL